MQGVQAACEKQGVMQRPAEVGYVACPAATHPRAPTQPFNSVRCTSIAAEEQ